MVSCMRSIKIILCHYKILRYIHFYSDQITLSPGSIQWNTGETQKIGKKPMPWWKGTPCKQMEPMDDKSEPSCMVLMQWKGPLQPTSNKGGATMDWGLHLLQERKVEHPGGCQLLITYGESSRKVLPTPPSYLVSIDTGWWGTRGGTRPRPSFSSIPWLATVVAPWLSHRPFPIPPTPR